jgi:hypothetical protein
MLADLISKLTQARSFTIAEAGNNTVPVKLPQRKSNISFNDTVRELCDNCIDAQATKIDIFLYENAFSIVDNGKGMDLRDLDDAFVTNSSTKHNDKTLIGKWGVGLKQSIIQFNKDKDETLCHIVSGTYSERMKRPVYAYGEFSPKIINANIEKYGVDGWKIPSSIDLHGASEKTSLQTLLLNTFFEIVFEKEEFHTGTIVLIQNTSVPELIKSNLKYTVESLKTHLGEAYFNILKQRKLKINIHDKTNKINEFVSGNDFLLRDIPGTQVFSQWEYKLDDIPTPLKFTIVITPKEKNKSADTYLPINNDNNGIYLVCNNVVVARATKNHVVTPDIKKHYLELRQDKKIVRKKLWFNSNDSYSTMLRVAIECDGHWQKYIQLDQEKIAFTFHDDLSKELANLMIQLDKALQKSNQITSDDTRIPIKLESEDNTPTIKVVKTPDPKPITLPKNEVIPGYDPIIDIIVDSEIEATHLPAILPIQTKIIEPPVPEISLNNFIKTDELWDELTKSLIDDKDKYLQPLLNDFTKELREKLLSL